MHTTSKLSIIAAAASLLAALSAFGAASDPSGLTLVDLTSPDGTVTSSVAFETAGPLTNAFNNDETLKTRVLRNGSSADIVYAFDEPTIVNSYGIYNYGDNNPDQRAPKTWTFSGSNDNGETWVPLDSHGDQDPETGWVASEYRFYYFENSTAYTSYKIDISGNNGNQYLQFARMEFYNVNLADAVPISFGEPSFASDSTSVSVSQPYTLREGATVTGVSLFVGQSADSLSVSTVVPEFSDGVASFGLENLSSHATYFWQLKFAITYYEASNDWTSDVSETMTRKFDTLVPGSTTFLNDSSWGSGSMPSDDYVDVRIDGDAGTTSTVTLTASSTSVAYSYGALTVDDDDSIKLTKSVNGNASIKFLSLTNDGIVNVNGHAAGNAQSVSATFVDNVVNNGTINVNGSSARNRTVTNLNLPPDFVNNGTINVIQPSSDRNQAHCYIKGYGEAQNNGKIVLRLTGTTSSATNARLVIDDATANGFFSFLGNGSIVLEEGERTPDLSGSMIITCTAYSTIVTNGVNHTITGAGSVDRFALVNDGLVVAIGDNLPLSVQNTYMDLGGLAMVNTANGRFVAAGKAGLYLGANTTKNSRFLNYGLLEARTGSFIGLRTGLTEQNNKGTVATSTATKQGGRWAGGGEFRIPRPLTLLEGAVLAPGDLANTLAQDGETVIYGTGESTCGTLTFTNSLTLSAGTVSEFQLQGRDRFDALHVGGNLTLGGTFKVVGKPHGGTFRIITADASISGEFDAIDMSAADGAKAPKLTFGSTTVEEEVPTGETDAETGEPIMTTVSHTTYYVDAEILSGFTVIVR